MALSTALNGTMLGVKPFLLLVLDVVLRESVESNVAEWSSGSFISVSICCFFFSSSTYIHQISSAFTTASIRVRDDNAWLAAIFENTLMALVKAKELLVRDY
jgi:hypothetical protein